MKNLVKTVSFLSVMSVLSVAFAATSRVSMIGKATSRLPSIIGHVNPVAVLASGRIVTTTTGATTGATLLSNSDCIKSYQDCITASDVCGEDFEECPTNLLFHGQIHKCITVLSQCSASGIYDLFGTSSINSLKDVAETNDDGEVVLYRFPAKTSIVGMMIDDGYRNNILDTQQCVKKYQRCLAKDEVCGADYELCTTPKEFKKQALLCSSTLARCESEGKKALFGEEGYKTMTPEKNSILADSIEEGNKLAAYNTVNTCYKVADQCILNACGKNPVRCMPGSTIREISWVDFITQRDDKENSVTVTPLESVDEEGNNIIQYTTKIDVNRYVKNMCQETIGTNKYCFTTIHGTTPSKKDLLELDTIEDTFGEIYALRMNSAMKERLQNVLSKFDASATDKCVNTIKSCAMRTCGKGVGSVCYSKVYGADTGQKSINGSNTRNEILLGCDAVVNMDPYCQYIASTLTKDNKSFKFNISFNDDTTPFTVLFPVYDGTATKSQDPIGVVGALNQSLQDSFNPNAIAALRDKCARTAESCVITMCGKDYENCYRNRTDIMSNLYNSDDETFDNSMNRMGGILDYTIISGFCLGTVKKSQACDEHFKIAQSKIEQTYMDKEEKASWGWSKGVRSDWLDAAKGEKVTGHATVEVGSIVDGDMIVVGYGLNDSQMDYPICQNIKAEVYPEIHVDEETGCTFDREVTNSIEAYKINKAADTLFQEVLADIESKAQAKYKAELTKRANMCRKRNDENGVSTASSDSDATYAWVKLRSPKKTGQAITGYTSGQLVTSNDVYNSFCRVKVTLLSTEPYVNEVLANNNAAYGYFGVGETINCGAWVKQDVIKKIVDKARTLAGDEFDRKNKTNKRIAMAWAAIGGTALGAGVGGGIASALSEKYLGKGLASLASNRDQRVAIGTKTNAGSCVSNIDSCLSSGNAKYCYSALSDAYAAGISGSEYGNVARWTIIDGNDCNAESAKICKGEDIGKGILKGCACNAKISGDLYKLRSKCSSTYQSNMEHNSALNTGLGAGIGGAVGLALGLGVTATVFDAKRANAQNSAEDELMEALGEIMSCYVGPTEVTTYGKTFGVTLND